VLVHLRVTLAFPSAGVAIQDADLELDPQQLPIRVGPARKVATGRRTKVGAIEVQSDAAAAL